MATKKSAKSTSTARKTAPKKPATKVTTLKARNSAPSRNVAAATGSATARKLDSNVVNIVLAEIVGTFVLAMVVLMAASDIVPLFVGLTLALLVMTIGAVSGSHVNPAVTFGLWASRRLKSVLLPFYWGAQFIGAMAAVVILNLVAGTQTGLDFSNFATFSWPIMWIELIGTAVFLFGFASVTNRKDLSAGGKAIGIGLSLFVGLVVAGSLYAPARQAAINDYQANASAVSEEGAAPEIPHEVYVSGATLNPALALAVTETSESELKGTQAAEDEAKYTRFSLEVIIGTLVGAALGANLSWLLAYRFRG